MSTTPLKQILALGLATHLNIQAMFGVSSAQIIAGLEAQATALRTKGYEMTPFGIDPTSPEKAAHDFEKLREMLRSKESWAAISIGFGIRGTKEHTSVFEQLVNLCIEELGSQGQSTKFMFVTGPEDLSDAVKRVLG